MTDPTPSEAAGDQRRPGFLAVLGTALLVGLVGSLLFSFHDSVRAVLIRPSAGLHLRYSEMLAFGVRAGARYALVGCGFMALVGLYLGLLIRTGRSTLAVARLLGVQAAMLAFFFLSVLLTVRGEDAAARRAPPRQRTPSR